MNIVEFERNYRRLLQAKAPEYLCPILLKVGSKQIEGMSCPETMRTLNYAISLLPKDESYLEVGVHQGLSFIAAVLNNLKGRSSESLVGVDNFSEFGSQDSKLCGNLTAFGLQEKVTFVQDDCWDYMKEALSSSFRHIPIGVYFYDGAHDYKSHVKAFEFVEPLLADQALVLVDDVGSREQYEKYDPLPPWFGEPHQAQEFLLGAYPKKLRRIGFHKWSLGLDILEYVRCPA